MEPTMWRLGRSRRPISSATMKGRWVRGAANALGACGYKCSTFWFVCLFLTFPFAASSALAQSTDLVLSQAAVAYPGPLVSVQPTTLVAGQSILVKSHWTVTNVGSAP